MVMKIRKSILVVAAIAAVGTLCSLTLPQEPEKAKNLKVLPKNMEHEELITVMKSFNAALGVKCNFCHEPRKDDPKKLDFASDANEHKGIARDMLRMTQRINKKFFKGSETMSVTCYTCHNGNKEPKVKPDAAPEAAK